MRQLFLSYDTEGNQEHTETFWRAQDAAIAALRKQVIAARQRTATRLAQLRDVHAVSSRPFIDCIPEAVNVRD
jgi:hypothetical protein